ncbi:MAG: serine hydrolase [Chitinophagaceae bacterium]|nr:serine hydrolase [Chitinophagaceae bacterium]
MLHAKYQLGLANMKPIEMENLLEDLNAQTNEIRYQVASHTITLLREEKPTIPLPTGKKTAYIGIGVNGLNDFGKRVFERFDSDNYFLSYKESEAESQAILKALAEKKYDQVIISIHDYSNRPANNYGISTVAKNLVLAAQQYKPVTMLFGNVMAAGQFCEAVNLLACYQDDDITQHTAADVLEGKIVPQGQLPVSVCDFKYGHGVQYAFLDPARVAGEDKMYGIDSIALDAIAKKAFPGCVVVAAKDGEIIYSKAFGTLEYDKPEPLTLDHVFDLASVTKISATTISIMKLYEEGKIKLDGKLGDYLPVMRGTNKANLRIDDILLHQAGLVPFISFYKETIDEKTGIPNPAIYSNKPKKGFSVRVAENLYRRDDWSDTLMKRIIQSPVGPKDKYVYSDNDFILLGKIVEQLSGLTLDEYTYRNFYQPMGLASMGFTPRKRAKAELIVPTEEEQHFRRQLLRGDVHDEGASLFGGVAGHAGLFSNAYDLVALYQMLLNGGELNGTRYFQPETIELFTSYQSNISRRGLGFDKPEKDNATRPDPYPALSVSPKTFGHTGFTGTCVWADPESNLVYVFLSNRVYPTRNNPKLSQMNIRTNIQDWIYRALK